MAPYFVVRLPNCYQCTPLIPELLPPTARPFFPGQESPVLNALENKSAERSLVRTDFDR
jgi:hypothetical protein